MATFRPRQSHEMPAVFIASTPLQYINAREAAEVFDVRPRAMVIPLVNYDREVFELMEVDSFWPETIFVPRPHPEMLKDTGWFGMGVRLAIDWFFYRRLTAIARRLAPTHTLFVGFYDAYYQRHFANQLAPNRLVSVDDGAATISIHQRRATGPSPEPRPRQIRIRHSLLGVDYREWSKITLFTAYDLEEAHDPVVRNNYTHFGEQFDESIDRSAEIWLLGQPVIVDSAMDLRTYVRCVRCAVDAYGDTGPVRYIPHPREETETVGTILDRTRVRLKETSGPIEWELATASVWPRRLAGFCSSAIQTCRKIFGDQLPTDVLLPDSSIWEITDEDTAEVYSMYRESTLAPHRFVELSG